MGMLSIWSSFAELPDPRTGNAQRHNLLDVLTIALTAVICGAESCVDFADFARDREALFRDFLELPGGLPSHDTFSRLFRLLDPAAFAACFAHFLDGLGEAGPGVIAIDGKTMRRSFDRAAGRSALHVVTAFAADARMVVGQVAAGDRESEITAARTLLGLLDLNGALVTGDALHCQGETARLINERGGDWLFTLKANRPVQHKEVAEWFADPQSRAEPEHVTTDSEHGRIEVRRHVVCHGVDWMLSDRRYPDEARLPSLGMIGMVAATVTRDGRTSTLRRYYLSSAPMDAVRFAVAVRSHWRIENSLHWVLDVGFDEDRARNRRDHGPENLTTLRKFALNVLRSARPDISVRRKRKRSGWSNEFARSVLGQMR
jgi:predicted transposase YbfD/YdcC